MNRGNGTTDLHMSTLGGLHMIHAAEHDKGNVFQTVLRGRWRMRGLFIVETGERLMIDRDGRARWHGDRWEGLGATRWGLPES